MKRRVFLKSGILAGIGIGLPRNFLRASGAGPRQEPSIPEALLAGMIWASESAPILVGEGGSNSSIAGPKPEGAAASETDEHAAFIKDVSLAQIPTSAQLHLFAYTRYRLYVNGQYAGRGPSRFQNQRPEYDTRNILPLLSTGRNRIAVLVHRDAPTGRIMHHDPGFAAVLEWTEPGGLRKELGTDATWRARPELSFGPRDKAWSSIEEHIDARRSENWTDSNYDASDWPFSVPVRGETFVPLWPRTTPLQSENRREWHSVPGPLPITLNTLATADFELGEIIQGYHRLQFDSQEDSEIEVTYWLPEESKSGANTYIARAGSQIYIGGDTFAFKKLSVRLKSGTIRLQQAEAFEVRYPFERVGSFKSSDPFLNQLWTICARSLEVVSEDGYVDCADRERVEWIDCSPPSFDCTRAMMAGPSVDAVDGPPQFGDARLLKAMLRRIALTQQPDGQIKAHSCSERWDIHAIMEDRSCDWVLQLREYFDSTGDRELLRELWPALMRLLSWFLTHRSARGLVLAREWEVWDNPLSYQVCEGAGLNAIVYRALRAASYLGSFIEKKEASTDLATAADDLALAYNTLLWDASSGSYYGGLFGSGSKMNPRLDGKMFTGPIVHGHYPPTAQAALFALYCGIVPTERVAAVRKFVLSHLGEITRLMSHYYLFHALYALQEEQQDALILAFIRSGWKKQVESPWQTTWEDISDEGGSKIHGYGMIPGFFLSAYVLGVRREEAVWKRSIVIEPRAGDLSRAKGIVVTEFGAVPIAWSRTGGTMTVEVTVPPRTTATLRLPRGSGNHPSLMVDGKVQQARLEKSYWAVSLIEGRHKVENVS